MTLVAVIAGLAGPDLFRLTRALRLEMAARELVMVLRTARSDAIRNGRKVGVRFQIAERHRVSFALYADGDGDGVRTADIESGIDPQISPVKSLIHVGRRIRLGFPSGPAPRDPADPGRRMDRLHDPVRFGRSDIASFNSLGGSTPGSLFITDSGTGLAVVRVLGQTGRIRVLTYEAESEVWK